MNERNKGKKERYKVKRNNGGKKTKDREKEKEKRDGQEVGRTYRGHRGGSEGRNY